MSLVSSGANVSGVGNAHLEYSEPKVRCVDLFCGVGGLTHGLIRKGVEVVKGVDIDPQCRFPYESNNDAEFVEVDVCDLSKRELEGMFGNAKLRLLAGCAPCQPFSKYSRRGPEAPGSSGKRSKKRATSSWTLVSEFGRLVREVQPELVTMENVPQLPGHRVFKDFLGALEGYSVWWDVVNCDHYGIPQTRRRLVLLASRLGAIELTSPGLLEENITTVREAICDMPAIAAGCSDKNDALHRAPSLGELNLRRIRASKPGGSWRDWDEALIADCHRKESGRTYPGVYGRMEWDRPAPTITTQCFGFGNGRFGHPEQDRAISLREAAILQTFPSTYRFLPPGEKVRFNVLGRLIGNAVPVRLGEIVGQSLIEHVSEKLVSNYS